MSPTVDPSQTSARRERALLPWSALRIAGALALLGLHAAGCSHGQDRVKEALPFRGANISAVSAVFSPDGGRIAVPRAGGRIEIWGLSSGRCEVVLTTPRPDHAARPEVVFSNDGEHLAALYQRADEQRCRISIWDLRERSEKVVATMAPDEVALFIGLSSDASLLTAILATDTRKPGSLGELTNDRTVRWRLPDGEREAGVSFPPNQWVTELSPDGRFALTASRSPTDPKIRFLVNLADGRVLWRRNLWNFAQFTDDSRDVLGFDGKQVLLIDTEMNAEQRLLETGSEDIGRSDLLAVSPDRKLLAICGYDSNMVRIFDTATSRELGRFAYCPSNMLGSEVAFSPDDRLLLTTTGYVGTQDQPKEPMLRFWRLPEKWRTRSP